MEEREVKRKETQPRQKKTSATGRVQTLLVWFFLPTWSFIPNRQSSNHSWRQAASLMAMNKQWGESGHLSLLGDAPARAEVAGFPDGSHIVLPTLALVTLFPGAQGRAALAHQSWWCPALTYMFNPTTALLNQIICMPKSMQLNLSTLCSSKGCAALLENWGDPLNTINHYYWPQPAESHLLPCHFAFHGINQHWVYSESQSIE